MSWINHNNLTNESTKNELYNSYENIKKTDFLDESFKNNLLANKISLKNKFLQNKIISSNDNSHKYCLTTFNFDNLNQNKYTPKSFSNSFKLINYSPENKKIFNTKKSLSYQIKKVRQKLLYMKEQPQIKNTQIKIYNSFLKNKKKEYQNNFINYKNISKKNIVISNSNNKTKLKELKFKVFSIIKNNYVPLCPNFLSKSEMINNKILEYYISDNFKKLLRIYNNNVHYNIDIEGNPKINNYTNISKINEESSFTKKLNLDKLFNKEEKKLLLSEPDYYFKNTNKDCFENINIIKAKKLVVKINKEDIAKEELEKKKIRKNKTANKFNKNEEKEKNNILNKTEYRINNNTENYMDEYRYNKKLIENLIKKEEKIKKEKEKKMLNIEDAFNKEIKKAFYKYRYLIYKNNKIKAKKKPIIINKTENLGTRKNLIQNNYKHIMRYEGLIQKLNKINEKGINNIKLNVIKRPAPKENLKNYSNSKKIEYIKMLLNQIKNIYNK